MKKFSLFFAALFVCALSMAEVVTFDANIDHGNASTAAGAYQVTKDGITFDVTQGRLGTAEGGHYRIYQGNTLTMTSTVGAITKVEFTCTANNTTKYGPGNLTADSGEYTYQDKVGTWVGNASTIVFAASLAQVRASKIVVTYEAGTTAVDDLTLQSQATKVIENGQLVIIKNGVRYNAMGQTL